VVVVSPFTSDSESSFLKTNEILGTISSSTVIALSPTNYQTAGSVLSKIRDWGNIEILPVLGKVRSWVMNDLARLSQTLGFHLLHPVYARESRELGKDIQEVSVVLLAYVPINKYKLP
jgi:hypothetical protein